MTEQPPPSKGLTNALRQYGEELEAIKLSVESAMFLFGEILKDRYKGVEAFAREYGQPVEADGKALKFELPAHRVTEFRRLQQSISSLRSSQRLMPRNLVVAMVCTYDALLGKVIRFILETKPGMLDSSDRSFSFAELQRFDSISAAREYILEKEVETVLRKSHTEHFHWLESKLKTPFNKGLESWPTFVELTERRNLFVHTDGVVSSQYLSVCNEHKCKLGEGTKIGTKLGVPQAYFEESYRCLYEIGIKLSHVVWRKLLKDDLDQIDANLNDVTLDLIEKREYKLAISVLEFFTQTSMAHSCDAEYRVMLINLAQSYKWDHQDDRCLELLGKHDWSSSQDKFRLAVAVLKSEWDVAYAIMKRLCHDVEFDKAYFMDWPLFKDLRKQDKFPAVYEECYKERFSSPQAIPAQQQVDGEEEDDQESKSLERG